LEVGCGEGSNLLYLQRRLPDLELVGIDFSLEKVRFLGRSCPRSKAVCSDATSLPFGRRQFDVVLYRDLLHHVSWAREKVLTEGLRVLRNDGVVIVFESNGRTLLNRLFQRLYPAERGMRDSTPAQLLALGSRLGRPTIEHVEASFLVRALGFVVGWPEDAGRWLIRPLYMLARGCERLIECLIPRHCWSYMMMTLRHG
jgi:SAM-dependent methyltransferase